MYQMLDMRGMLSTRGNSRALSRQAGNGVAIALVPIDRGIPCPGVEKRTGRPSFVAQIAAGMEVGDSVLAAKARIQPRALADWARKNNRPERFLVRKTPDGVRVWRTA